MSQAMSQKVPRRRVSIPPRLQHIKSISLYIGGSVDEPTVGVHVAMETEGGTNLTAIIPDDTQIGKISMGEHAKAFLELVRKEAVMALKREHG